MASLPTDRQPKVRLLGRRHTAEVASDHAPEDDPLAAFSVESAAPKGGAGAPPYVPPAPVNRPAALKMGPSTRRIGWLLGIGITVAIVASIVAFLQTRAVATKSPTADWGRVSIDTLPQGVPVSIDGEARGVSPLTISLKPGPHVLKLVSGGQEKQVPLVVATAATLSQYYEFAPAAPAARVGRLSVSSDPPAARIQVDGKPRGTAPLVVADLDPGEHIVSASGEGGTVDRKVVVEAGGTASVVFSLPKTSGPAAGWLAVSAPFDVQLFDNGDLIGTGGSAKVMLPTGRHDIHVVSQTLGYDDTRRVDVTAGKVSTVRIDPPKTTISANARPWANVTIDDEAVGQTPLSNVAVSIGTHQVVFRHPQLGEQRQTIVVTMKGPNRISADMTKK